jgi:nitroreductase
MHLTVQPVPASSKRAQHMVELLQHRAECPESMVLESWAAKRIAAQTMLTAGHALGIAGGKDERVCLDNYFGKLTV